MVDRKSPLVKDHVWNSNCSGICAHHLLLTAGHSL
jgi:hypothetical protein